MFNKFELAGGIASIGIMAFALYLSQIHTTLFQNSPAEVTGEANQTERPSLIAVDGSGQTASLAGALEEASDNRGNLRSMVIDDIKIGTGEEVKNGDTVSVHYIGTLQDGTEFDNSRKRGAPIEFEVGAGRVIQGWEEGLIGMKVGGERVLVIPPEMAYGEAGVGPIPPNATLVFALELMAIN
jgi:peptidylprolyl isomerase